MKNVILLFFCIAFVQINTYSQTEADSGDQTKKPITDTTTNSANRFKTNKNERAKPAGTSIADSSHPNYNEPEVISVRNVKKTNDSSLSAGIGDDIIITVLHFDNLLKSAKASHQNISLFIDGRKIISIQPPDGAPDRDSSTFQYELDRNTTNDKIWADILGSPSIGKEFFKKHVKISVGLENGYAIRIANSAATQDGTDFSLIRIHDGWFWTCSVIVILYLYLFVSMVQKRGLLRDRDIDLNAIGIISNSSLNPYSLGRCQMAFWFTLTVVSFFFIWLITDAYNIISTTVLALIGISAGTSLSAAVIDNNKSTDLLNQTIALQDEAAKLTISIPALQSSIANPPVGAVTADLQNQLTTQQARTAQIPTLIANNKALLMPRPSKGFLNDVLADANGISFHRLQMFVWTFVLGLIFIYSVWKSLSMPDFDATLLALQGLTAGTYLGFKFPEK